MGIFGILLIVAIAYFVMSLVITAIPSLIALGILVLVFLLFKQDILDAFKDKEDGS